MDNVILKWVRYFNRHHTKNIYRWQQSIWEDSQHQISVPSCKSKNSELLLHVYVNAENPKPGDTAGWMCSLWSPHPLLLGAQNGKSLWKAAHKAKHSLTV